MYTQYIVVYILHYQYIVVMDNTSLLRFPLEEGQYALDVSRETGGAYDTTYRIYTTYGSVVGADNIRLYFIVCGDGGVREVAPYKS